LSGWVKADQAHKAVLDLQYVDAEGEWGHGWAAFIGMREAGDRPANHDWRLYSGEVVVPAEAAKVIVALQMYGPGTVWFDDIELSLVDMQGEALLGNIQESETGVLIENLKSEYRTGRVYEVARALADLGDPRTIPVMISVIDADNSYDTVYGVGYFGLGFSKLGELTGVRYKFYHDGAWWRRWWGSNKTRFPEDVRNTPIPDLPKTENGKNYMPFPEELDTLEGKLSYLRKQFDSGQIQSLNLSDIAKDLAELGAPRAIPVMIGVIDADNSYDTIYGVGYFGLGFSKLGELTGVEYSEFHDGAWWRRWWQENKARFPQAAQDTPIPDLPKTENGRKHSPFSK